MNGIADLKLVQFRINHSNTERILASEILSGLSPPSNIGWGNSCNSKFFTVALAFTTCYLEYYYKELTKSFDCHSFTEPNIDSCPDWRLEKLWGSKPIANLIWKLFIRGWQAGGSKPIVNLFCTLFIGKWNEWKAFLNRLVRWGVWKCCQIWYFVFVILLNARLVTVELISSSILFNSDILLSRVLVVSCRNLKTSKRKHLFQTETQN